MISRKLFSVIGGFVLGAAALVPAAKAGGSDQLTKMTFSQPVEVAGRTLPAGTYWFKIWDQQNDMEQSLIDIYTADFSHLVMVAPARPVQRRETGYGTAVPVPSMNKTELRLATETEDGHTVLITWFYPYGYDGHQYVQSRNDRRELHDQPLSTVSNQTGKEAKVLSAKQ